MREENRQGKSIRFITSDYTDLFRIEDGCTILVTFPDRQFVERCGYIDDYHLKIGNSVYHICEYAEMLERNGGHCEPAPETALDRAAWQIGRRGYLKLERTETGFRKTGSLSFRSIPRLIYRTSSSRRTSPSSR